MKYFLLFFTTTIDSSANDFDCIYFSAGKIGRQVKVSVSDISKVIDVSYSDVIKNRI